MNTLNAQDIKGILRGMALVMEEKKEELGALDQVIGDGDLGLTMSKGFRAVSDAVGPLEETDLGKILGKAGMVMASAVPSTMGTLMATGLMRGGKAVMGRTELGLSEMASVMSDFVGGLMERGKSQPGDKTIIDALHPAAQALDSATRAGATLRDGLKAAAQAAWNGLEATKQMVSQHGKAACFQEQTLGKQDPGATVGAYLMQAFADYVK